LLFEDLANVTSYGYQSRFDRDTSMGTPVLSNTIQGSLIKTNENEDYAIVGRGFFKIILPDNTIGYTRNGHFRFSPDDTGNLTLQLYQQGQNYSLADPITFYMAIIKTHNSAIKSNILEVVQTNNINALSPRFKNYVRDNDEILITELYAPKIAEQLKVYDVPYDKLQHYHDGIYVLDPHYTDEIVINFESRVMINALEMSTVPVLEVLTRMYYLLSTDETIKNRAFKADMVKIMIQKSTLSNESEIFAEAMLNLEEKLQRFLPRDAYWNYKQDMMDAMQRYLNKQDQYIQAILPFIRYDY
jgi:flagellar basal body rod protein FlgG